MSQAVILNVDDNEPARYARTRILLQAGYAVHEASTGREALAIFDQVHPDIVLCDVNMPDIDGIEVCRRIKSSPLTAATIVIQISASALSAAHATSALNTGADTYVFEPVDPDVLVATVRAFLRIRDAERALSKANEELSVKNEELNRLNQALLRSNEDLEHFAFVASHDLQEPLRTIVTHLQLLERVTGSQPDPTARYLQTTVLEGARRMSTLINDILAYSRISTEPPDLVPAQLEEAVSWARENLSDALVESGASVQVAETLPIVAGDPSQLGQLFQNLIGNSIKYRTPNVPLSINISADRDREGNWLVRLQDNGIGIASEHLEKIFRPFKRLHGQEIPGNGIGLALCRRIIDVHGGRIWAESAEGSGSTFFFTLRPAVDAAQV